ncbi:isochorismate synthase [Rothia sp. AR01]|uniref:isochorismate synthase n=1 Tax=Rothia santali TaxID=2949643 RepID=A0A9X2HFX6_9MICC|nr:isochorismate synthase [Rothia santali]MCP3424996.1 isochorismate synthase [Rothia santali]
MSLDTFAPGGSPAAAEPVRRDPDFTMTSGRWTLRAEGGERAAPAFADPDAAPELLANLRERERATGRAHVLYGMIPFDLSEPADLRVTDRAAWRPRSVEPAALGSAGDPLPPEDSPAYRSIVADALERIEAEEVQKVVLSRTMTLDLGPEHRAEAERVIAERLAASSRRADVFRVRLADGATWIGASPEIIADVSDSRFLTHPLAGSLPRVPGGLDAAQAAARLAGSAKDLHEHRFVTRHIVQALEPLAREISAPEEPELFGTDAMWHLGTRIGGRLRPEVSALEAALAIHPTPAVGGAPTQPALRMIRELEGSSRGFYSGLVGWTDSSGNGRWSLVLRCASLRGDALTLYAGAGVVAGSTPSGEHAETGAKFSTMLRTLEGLL